MVEREGHNPTQGGTTEYLLCVLRAKPSPPPSIFSDSSDVLWSGPKLKYFVVGNVGSVLLFCKFVDLAYGSVHKPVTEPAWPPSQGKAPGNEVGAVKADLHGTTL